MNNKSKTPAATGASELMGNKFNRNDMQLFGACLIRPALSRFIPGIVSNRLSPFGIHAMNLMQSGASIEAVAEGLTASGVENAEAIVRAALASVPDNRETQTFWRVIRRLCDEVLP